MYPWLWFWAPQFRAPLSGDVAQRIEPDTQFFFRGIKPGAGNARIEEKAFSVATYGKQLGLITEILLELSDRSGIQSSNAAAALAQLKAISREIEDIKEAEYARSAADIEASVQGLQRRGGTAYAELANRLLPLLTGTLSSRGESSS